MRASNWNGHSLVQRNSQEEIANGRGPSRPEEDRRVTGQGTPGSREQVFLFYSIL